MTQHAKKALRTALGDAIEDRHSRAHEQFHAGLRYVSMRPEDRSAVDRSLDIAGVRDVARLVLADGKTLIEASRELGGPKTGAPARSWAAGRLAAATAVMVLHGSNPIRELMAIEYTHRHFRKKAAVSTADKAIPYDC